MTAQPETQSLAAWILERVAEDEAAARAAQRQMVSWWTPAFLEGAIADHRHVNYEAEGVSDAVASGAAHIARHDPARVLAQCAAVRDVVALHGPTHVCTIDASGSDETVFQDRYRDPCPTLTALAGIWGYEGAEVDHAEDQ